MLNDQIITTSVGNTTRIKSRKYGNKSLLKQLGPKIQSFEEKLMKHQDLVVIEMNLPPPIVKNKEVIPFKKNDEINTFLLKSALQKQNLTIPELAKVRKPVDISKNIIENEPKIKMIGVNIQSDEFMDVNVLDPNNKNTNNVTYNKIKANSNQEFNLYLEKNTKTYVDDTPDIDNTSYINTNNYMAQKIGKDACTQIEDGDLFNFDLDVIPILSVVTNKILEQAQLELMEEFEIKKLRETKQKFHKKLAEEKARVKKIELEEINRKKDIDGLKKIKHIDRMNKVLSQQKLLARVSAKTYFSQLKLNSFNLLKKDNIFCNFKQINHEETAMKLINAKSNLMNNKENYLISTVKSMYQECITLNQNDHSGILNNKKREQDGKLQEEIERQKKAKILEEQAKKERENRRNLKRINKLRTDIKNNIIKASLIKESEYFQEDNIFGIGGFDGLNQRLFGENRSSLPYSKCLYL